MDKLKFKTKVHVLEKEDEKINTAKEKKQNESLKSLFKDFTQSTGLHGANKMAVENNRIRGLLWVLALAASMIYLLITVTKELNAFYTYPTNINTKMSLSNKLTFPAVTICNMSPLSRSRLGNYTKFKDYYMGKSAFVSLSNPVDWNDPIYNTSGFFNPLTEDDVIMHSGLLDKLFMSCLFSGDRKSCAEEFRPILTPGGLCFQANTNGTHISKFGGSALGMVLMLNVNQWDYYWSADPSAGVKIFLHANNEEPNFMARGFQIPPGARASVAINRKKYEYLPYPYKAFTNGYCLDTQATGFVNPLKKTSYSVHTCYRQCFAKKIYNICGCVDLQDNDMDLPICSHQLQICYYQTLIGMTRDEQSQEECACQSPCQRIEFDYKLSYSQFPSDFFGSEMVELFNIHSVEYIRSNMIFAEIFYDDLTTFHTQQTPLYASSEQIFANLGGQMGLFLGASILTVTEIGEFIMSVIWFLVIKRIFRLE